MTMTDVATTAGIATLAEGLRSGHIPGVDVSVSHPGDVRSEADEFVQQPTPFMAVTETGVRSTVQVVAARTARAYDPARPGHPSAWPCSSRAGPSAGRYVSGRPQPR